MPINKTKEKKIARSLEEENVFSSTISVRSLLAMPQQQGTIKPLPSEPPVAFRYQSVFPLARGMGAAPGFAPSDELEKESDPSKNATLTSPPCSGTMQEQAGLREKKPQQLPGPEKSGKKSPTPAVVSAGTKSFDQIRPQQIKKPTPVSIKEVLKPLGEAPRSAPRPESSHYQKQSPTITSAGEIPVNNLTPRKNIQTENEQETSFLRDKQIFPLHQKVTGSKQQYSSAKKATKQPGTALVDFTKEKEQAQRKTLFEGKTSQEKAQTSVADYPKASFLSAEASPGKTLSSPKKLHLSLKNEYNTEAISMDNTSGAEKQKKSSLPLQQKMNHAFHSARPFMEQNKEPMPANHADHAMMEKIEKLRHSFQQLNSEKIMAHKNDTEQPFQVTQKREKKAAKQVFIIENKSKPSRRQSNHAAFWERRYLGRFG